ncbi:hypothetical protein PR202_ga01553 [Eleusine coracana subsp. coracana]|uniref:CBM-cenC domain-containing protein n=1 Tax=Eleusine coracana subsp. coracana TaxID=191504 RepID=A0AAV5BIJ4_ELECO|nr:hypothetical protein PR202_ga00866 [Eleusine coracana subsp. coracana]GJM85757.1 hypothetical protein PR202_ga01553 [Eleusine coracana subsp. coracana]
MAAARKVSEAPEAAKSQDQAGWVGDSALGLEQDITKKVTPGTMYFVSAYFRVHGELHEPVGVQATLKIENDSSSTVYLSIAGYFDHKVITDKLRLHVTYKASAWVRAGSEGHGRYHVNVCLAVDNQWVNGGQVEADGNQWYEVKGAFKLEKQPSKVTAYVQGPPPGVDLRVMGFQIYPVDRKARFEYLKEKTDKIRKRDIILKFEGSNAANLVGSSVRIQQTQNNFPFGSCIARHNIENEDLADFFVKNFN